MTSTHDTPRRGPGRPPLGDDAMVRRLYWVRRDQDQWLKTLAAQGASMGQVVRTALDSYKEQLAVLDEAANLPASRKAPASKHDE